MSRCGWLAVAWCSWLLPIAWAAFDWHWFAPWHDREMDACVGDFVLPSGLHLPVRRREHHLVAGEPAVALRRVAPRFYVSTSSGMRMRFEPADPIAAARVVVSGVGISVTAERAADGAVSPATIVPTSQGRLRLLHVGAQHDGPTVILEAGPFGSLVGIAGLQGDVAEFAQVVAYEHPGTGRSDPCRTAQHAAAVADQLREALAAASIEPPYVLVGMSMGGPYSRVFAHRYPDDVAGMVWIDPTPDWQDLEKWCEEHAPAFFERVHRAQLWGDTAVKTHSYQSPEVGRRASWDAMDETWQQFRSAWPLPNVPFVQITGAKNKDHDEGVAYKVRFFSDWLVIHVPHAEHVLATRSGHVVYAKQPELVVNSIRSVVLTAQAR